MDSVEPFLQASKSGQSNKLFVEIIGRGASLMVQPDIGGRENISDLIVNLKGLKEHTNEILSMFVQGDTKKDEVRKAAHDAVEDEEIDEPEEAGPTESKRQKAST